MKTIVFINTHKSGSSREAIRAAEALGYFTVLLTDRHSFLEGRTEFPDVHYMEWVDLAETQSIRRAIIRLRHRALEISSIMSFIDSHCHIACLLAEEFGVNRFSTDAIGRMNDKICSRKITADSPHSPRFISLEGRAIPSKNQIKSLLPAVLKSPLSTGSKDVLKAITPRSFTTYLKTLRKKFPHSPVLVEEFLDGPQYLVETVVRAGKVHIVAVIEQEITFKSRFIVTGYTLLHHLEKGLQTSLRQAVEGIISAHGMEYGACHLEMRLVKNEWKLIEANPRISGAGMNQFIEIGCGINLVKETLKLALGEVPDLTPKYHTCTFAEYITLSQAGTLVRVLGKYKASASPGVKHVYVKPRKGTHLTPPLSMGHRYAYVIATGKDNDEARTNAKYAASLIEFCLDSPDMDGAPTNKPGPSSDEDLNC